MRLALEFIEKGLDEIKELLAGGTLSVYSVARPRNPDLPVDRSAVLVSFTFAAPAFGPAENGLESPQFMAASVPAASVGTPGFARLTTADGNAVADLSAGPGDREIKFAEISCSEGAPVRITAFKFIAEGGWPEKPEYYETRPRSGYPLPTNP